MDCREKALEVEDLLNQPLHGNDLALAISVDPYLERFLQDAERDNIVRFLITHFLNRNINEETNVDPIDNKPRSSTIMLQCSC